MGNNGKEANGCDLAFTILDSLLSTLTQKQFTGSKFLPQSVFLLNKLIEIKYGQQNGQHN